MNPVWNTEVIYDESLTMVRKNGIAEAPLLFYPEDILSVTSADKTEEYEEGRDWILHKNMLRLPEYSRIYAFNEEELIFRKEKPGISFPTVDGMYSLFHEGHFFHDRQISVTYKKKLKDVSFEARFCGEMLPQTIAKLRNKKPMRIVLYGDSISVGANSSGMTLTTPFLPDWGSLTVEMLRRHYHTQIEFINSSKGGTDSYWGVKHAKTLVGDYTPDLAIIAFGMNDYDEATGFVKNIEEITNIITQASSKTEFILCATTMPNKQLKDFLRHQREYSDALKMLQRQGTIIADFYSMQKYLLKRKRFIDLTGNNVNHPNDFMIRCHAHLLCDMLIKK